jgi:hypothetical protein
MNSIDTCTVCRNDCGQVVEVDVRNAKQSYDQELRLDRRSVIEASLFTYRAPTYL